MIEIIAVAAVGMMSPADLGTKTSEIQQPVPIQQDAVAPYHPDELKLGASLMGTQSFVGNNMTIDDWRTYD